MRAVYPRHAARARRAFRALHSVREFNVQALRIDSEHICYELERWKTPEGKVITAKPPTSGHFDYNLFSYVLYQHHHSH